MEDELPTRDELLAELEPDQEEWERCRLLSKNEILARVSEQLHGNVALAFYLDEYGDDPVHLSQLLECVLRAHVNGTPLDGGVEVTPTRSDSDGWLGMFRVELSGDRTMRVMAVSR